MDNKTNKNAAAKMIPQKTSLVKNINAKKTKGISRHKSKTTFSKNAYREIENIWSE